MELCRDAMGFGDTLAVEAFFLGSWQVGKPKNLNLSRSKGSAASQSPAGPCGADTPVRRFCEPRPLFRLLM
jgi:hypothetical protein